MTFAMIACCIAVLPGAGEVAVKTWTLDAIHIRDPFILPVAAEKRYYLFGTHASHTKDFPVYWSSDLKTWEGPVIAFEKHQGFWADRDFWAPEVHPYQGRYFMFASFNAEKAHRGTQVLVADSPQGPYHAHGDAPATPRDWDCLDGTFFVDDGGQPWIVFCHEWTQIHDGEVCMQKLSPDLVRPIGEPLTLFKASSAPWMDAKTFGPNKGLVTDGPFLHRMADGTLLMLWSSFSKQGYIQSYARSESGRLAGPWQQRPTPWFNEDAGHGMLFRRFDGGLMLVMHRPNGGGRERACLFSVEERGQDLTGTPWE